MFRLLTFRIKRPAAVFFGIHRISYATILMISAFSIFLSLTSFSEKKTLAKSILMATLNGEPITLLDVIADTAPEEKKLGMKFSGEKLKKEKWKIRHQALEKIIDRRLVYEEFKTRGYKLPEDIIERMLDGLAKSLAKGDRKLLERKARKAGLSMDDLREQAKERAASSLLINERCSKSVYITPKQVYDYYLANRSDFTIPAKLNLQAILMKCSGGDSAVARFAERLKKSLKNVNDEKFASYAKLYSQGPNHKNGGNVGWISESDLRPEFKQLLTGSKVGSIHGPIRTPEGIYFIRVKDREEAVAKLFDNVKDAIREKLTGVEKEKKYKEYSKRLRKFAVIRYLD
jgi:peptidyl-prolyl cis-trans isomerase SurA